MTEMTLVVRFVATAVFALALAGCDRSQDIQFSPVVAAETNVKGTDSRWHKVPLTPTQTALLSRWLESHQQGWSGLLETPPLGAFDFRFETTDRHTYLISVFVGRQGDGAAYILSGTGMPLEHGLSVEDVRTLQAAAGTTGQ